MIFVVIWVNCPQVLAQVETNDSWMIIDFMSKRGAVVNFGPTVAPPSDWMTSKDESDVVVAFTKALAIFKVRLITVPNFLATLLKMYRLEALYHNSKSE